jgi:hypothetical protein
MSELKVNNISAVGSGIKISNPVGIRTAAPTTAGDALYVSGNTDIEGSVEVVTVQAQNYGVRIKSPANNGTSILQFTNNSGTTERAAIYADSTNGLTISTAGTPKVSVNSTGLLTALQQSRFVGASTFENQMNINGQAQFNNLAPLCSIIPTLGSHLVNLDYLNTTASKVYVVGMNENASRTNSHTLQNVASGTYAWITILGMFNKEDFRGNSI